MDKRVAIIGLGYVGLPVATHFAKKYSVIGFDKNPERVESLNKGFDITGEVESEDLLSNNLKFTCNDADLEQATFYIVAVPTPIDESKRPDLFCLLSASETVGKQLKKGDIVVFESTVYPGTTEDECVPVLEEASGLKCGSDFTVGYSPERINPGDKEHRFDTITKIVSGQDQATLDIIADMYASVVTAGIYRAPTIKTAEAAKIIENTQRDLNIALMNELSIIFNKMDIDTHDVIDAASTKWNFLPFKPGLVGGHCIGVDPYYLTYQAQRHGYQPEVILAGRRINDNTGHYVAQQAIKQLIKAGCTIKNAKVAVLGLTFKEDCPDLRNTRVVDIIKELTSYHIDCIVHTTEANKNEAKQVYDIDVTEWEDINDVEAIILAVPHKHYLSLAPGEYMKKFNGNKLIIDVKSALCRDAFSQAGIDIWRM